MCTSKGEERREKREEREKSDIHSMNLWLFAAFQNLLRIAFSFLL
jgi:hypothetical protein